MKTITPKYRVELKLADGDLTQAAWRGQATLKRLDTYVANYNVSLQPGGVNEHIRKRWPGSKVAVFARIVRQSDDETVCHASYPVTVRLLP